MPIEPRQQRRAQCTVTERAISRFLHLNRQISWVTGLTRSLRFAAGLPILARMNSPSVPLPTASLPPAGASSPSASATPAPHAPPEILQIVPATGWWLDVPELDEQTGAVMTNRARAIAFALCRMPDGSTLIRPVSNDGSLGICEQLTHEADAGLISKYKKRARAAAAAAEDEEEAVVEDRRTPVASISEAATKPNELALKHLKTALSEALLWVSDILDKDPGDDLLRQTRQQLRWMQGAVDNQRRPTASELGSVTLAKEIIPQLVTDDAYLAQMLTEIEGLYREL